MRIRVAAVAALLVLTGCTSGTGPVPPGTAPPPGPTVLPVPAGTGRPVTFRSVRMALPAGWKLRDQGYRACLDPVAAGGCTVEVTLLADLVRQAGGRPPSVAAADGWVFGPDDLACRNGGPIPGTASTRVESRMVALPSGPAAYARWRVTCADRADDFSPRLWLLAAGTVVVRQRSGDQAVDPEVDRLVASIRTG